MLGLFETILNLSMMGSIVILLIVIVRRLMRRIPTKYIYALWALAALKLLCPKSPSSVLSLFNYLPKKKISVSSQAAVERVYVTPHPVGSIPGKVLQHTNSAAPSSASSAVSATSSSLDIWQILMIIWIIGMAVLFMAILYKTFTMYRSLRNTKKIRENIYSGPCVSTPFVLGIFRPRIYMPQGLSEKEFEYLLSHERTHIRRKDMLFKCVWIITLIAHWFNPLVWIAYRLFEADMEMSCDEEVIKNIGSDLRADYCTSLVSFARKSAKPAYPASSLAFGKEYVKVRIKNIMNYKKTSMLISSICVLVVAFIFICGFLSPIKKKISAKDGETEIQKTSEGITQSESEPTAPAETEIPDVSADTSIVGDDGPLWGTPEYIAEHSDPVFLEIPELSLPDGELFTLALPRPDGTILIDCEVEKGAVFASDALGTYTRSFVVVGSYNSSDLIFIMTDALSDSAFTSYVEALREFGFTDVYCGSSSYIGYTQDGCYVMIEPFGDYNQYTSIRFSSSTSLDNDSMGAG